MALAHVKYQPNQKIQPPVVTYLMLQGREEAPAAHPHAQRRARTVQRDHHAVGARAKKHVVHAVVGAKGTEPAAQA